MTDHLTDEQLNEYLDASPVTSSPVTSSPVTRHPSPATRHPSPATRHPSPVTRHLATCPECRARLDDLRAVFAALESLSEVRPPSELTASILARLPQKQTSPAWKWIFAAQTIGALAIAAWLATSFELPAAMLAYQPPTFDTLLASLLTFLSSVSFELPTFDLPPFNLELSTFNLTFIIVSIAALWLVGNGLLLRAPAPRSR